MTLHICLLCWRDMRCSSYKNGRKSGAPCSTVGHMKKTVTSFRVCSHPFSPSDSYQINMVWPYSSLWVFVFLYQGWGLSLGLWFSSPAEPVECCRDPPAFQKGTLKYQSHLSHMLSRSGKKIHFAYVSAWTDSWETSFWCLTHCCDAGEIWRKMPKWYYLKGQELR